MEIRPPVEWDKGRAIEYLLESLDLNGHCNILPLYIGDDDTDEDAFKVVDRISDAGLSSKILCNSVISLLLELLVGPIYVQNVDLIFHLLRNRITLHLSLPNASIPKSSNKLKT